MTRLAAIWPPFGLRVTAGPIDLRVITDADIPELVDVIRAGIHDPAAQPFLHPWTDAPADEIAANSARHVWQLRSEFTPAFWTLQMAVRLDGAIIGCQELSAHDYLVTRSARTASWLGSAHHGRGIGTRMRRAICALAFDHLGTQEITSAAFTDNPASLGVSRKVGYVPNGTQCVVRRGEAVREQRLVLTPLSFVRGPDSVVVTGVDALRRFLELPD